MKKFGILFVVCFVMACGGVEGDTFEVPNEVADSQVVDQPEVEVGGFVLTGGFLEGMDEGEAFAVDATRLDVKDQEETLIVDVIAEFDGRAVMGRVITLGALSDLTTLEDSDPVDNSGMHCSGVIVGDWTSDRHALTTTLVREPLDTSSRIHFKMNFYDDENPIMGYFDVAWAE